MLIDISMPIRNGSVFRRGSPPVDISTRTFHHESEGTYETVMLSLPAHTGTHVDLVRRDNRIPLERMFGVGRLIDVPGQEGGTISLDRVENQVELDPGDFVFFRTGWSAFADTDRYYRHPRACRGSRTMVGFEKGQCRRHRRPGHREGWEARRIRPVARPARHLRHREPRQPRRDYDEDFQGILPALKY